MCWEYFKGELNIFMKFHLEISAVFLPVHLDLSAVNSSLLIVYIIVLNFHNSCCIVFCSLYLFVRLVGFFSS